MTGRTDPSPAEEVFLGRIADGISGGWSLHVAEADGRLAAMLALAPDQAKLDQLFIAPEFQGQGLGSMLLDFTRNFLPNGFHLRTAAANHGARRFYERRGLVLTGEGLHPLSGIAVCFYAWQS